MDTSIYNKTDKELLDWEFSLAGSDLRAHAWYHGNIPRNLAETLLQEEGEFLVRDSSSFIRSGDYVLSCMWKGVILHFLIHKEVLQPNTIYEQLGYRFENESFTTVQDLITCYVGNKEPISAKSGAIIGLPRTRVVPISRKNRIYPMGEGGDSEYVTIAQESARHAVLPAEALLIERSFNADSLNQFSLNLNPPDGLLEDLENIPEKISNLDVCKAARATYSARVEGSQFDLATFSSILLPTKSQDAILNLDLIQMINSRILEASYRNVAFYITTVDWEELKNDADKIENEEGEPKAFQNQNIRIFENILTDSQFRWNKIIERSISFSHFVSTTILGAEVKEQMLSKWIGIAIELKSSMGNFLSFCNVMRGLTCSKIGDPDGPIDWLKLRRDYTNSAFMFETTLRHSYNNILEGTEPYPPNTIIPNLLPSAVILEDRFEILAVFKNASEQDKLRLTVAHLRYLYSFCDSEKLYTRNMLRLASEINTTDLFLCLTCSKHKFTS